MIKRFTHLPFATRTALAIGVGFLLLNLLFLGDALLPAEGWALGQYDMRGLFYPWWERLRIEVLNGRLPLWDPRQFVGTPFLSNPQVAFFYPPTWLAILFPTRIGISLYVLLHNWLAGVGMVAFVAGEIAHRERENGRSITLSYLGPIAAGLVFMFSGFVGARLWVGHVGLWAVHAWLPLLLWLTARGLRTQRWQPLIGAAGVWGLAILAGHVTSLLTIGLIWFLFVLAVWQGLSPARRAWPSLLFLSSRWMLTVLLGLLFAAVQLLPTLELTRLAARELLADFGFATQFSYPPRHLITLFHPTYFGEPEFVGYWGSFNFEELSWSFGLVPLAVLGLALVGRVRGGTFYWLLMGLGLFLGLGSYNPLYQFFYDWVPVLRLTRAPARFLFLTLFGGTALSGIWLGEWLNGRFVFRPRWLLPHALLGGGLLGGLLSSWLTSTQAVDLDLRARAAFQLDGWVSGLIVWGLFTLFLWGSRTHLSAPRRWSSALLLLTVLLFDLWRFSAPLVQTSSMTPDPLWRNTRTLIGSDAGRILPWGISIFEQNGAWQSGLNTVFGYNTLELAAVQELAASIPDPRSPAYDVLAVKYVVGSSPQDPFLDGDSGLQLLGNEGNAWVYRRPSALPEVRLVGQALESQLPAIGSQLTTPNFDARRTVIVTDGLGCTAAEGEGEVLAVEKGNGRWRIETETTTPMWLVVSEAAYPGWQVTIDGQPARWTTAYTALRAVCVPAGQHVVEWRYRPTSLLWGGWISLLTMVGLLGIGGWNARRRYA